MNTFANEKAITMPRMTAQAREQTNSKTMLTFCYPSLNNNLKERSKLASIKEFVKTASYLFIPHY